MNTMTSPMETFSALLAVYAGLSLVTGVFLSQRPVTRGFGVFSDLRLKKKTVQQTMETAVIVDAIVLIMMPL